VKARFIAPAQQDLDEAVNYHNAKIPGLGDGLFEEVASPRGFAIFLNCVRRSGKIFADAVLGDSPIL
jgi:hypothetical protein